MAAKSFDLSFILKFVDKFSTPLKTAAGNLKVLDQQAKKITTGSLTNLGSALTGVGNKLSLFVTAPMMAGLYGVSKASRDFEDAWIGVKKTVGDRATDSQLKTLNNDIIEMSRSIPLATTELFKIAQGAGQFGIQVPMIKSFTETIAHLTATTDIMPESANKIARFAAASNMSQSSFSNLASSVVQLGNRFAASESEIMDVSVRLAAFGSKSLYKMSAANILAIATALKHVGESSYSGATSVQQVMNKIKLAADTGGPKLAVFAKTANMSMKGFADLFKKDAMKALLAFLGGLGTVEKRGVSAAVVLNSLKLRGMRANQTMFKLAGAMDVLKSAIDESNKGWTSNDAHLKEAEMRYATFSSQIQLLKNNLMAVFVPFGDILNKALSKAIPYIKKIAEYIKALSPNMKKFVMIAGFLFATLGPILIAVGTLVGLAAMLAPLAGGFVAALGLIVPIIAAIIGGVLAISYAIARWPKQAMGIIKFLIWMGLLAYKFHAALFKLLVKINPVLLAYKTIAGAIKKIFDALPKSIRARIIGPGGKDMMAEGSKLMAAHSVPNLGMGKGAKSQSEVTIKVKSDKGTEAAVENTKKSGDTSLNVINDGYLGFNYATF